MTTIDIEIKNKIARSPVAHIVCGNSDYNIHFLFDEEWAAHSVKTARFAYNGQYEDVVFEGDTCPAPIIRGATVCAIGVYAGDLHTTTPALIRCRKSILCDSGLPADPAPDVYAQLVELINSKCGNSGGTGIEVTAEVGQTIRVKAIDDSGKPTEWEAVDLQEKICDEDMVELLPATEMVFSEDIGGFETESDITIEPTTYLVNRNGVEHIVESVGVEADGSTLYFLGNPYFISAGDDNGLPFVIVAQDGMLLCADIENTELTLSIKGVTITKIPDKYLSVTPSDIESLEQSVSQDITSLQSRVARAEEKIPVTKSIYFGGIHGDFAVDGGWFDGKSGGATLSPGDVVTVWIKNEDNDTFLTKTGYLNSGFMYFVHIPDTESTTAYAVKVVVGANGTSPRCRVDTIPAEIPEVLPNPHALTFTGAVEATYDGSDAVSVKIPSGGGGAVEAIVNETLTEAVAEYAYAFTDADVEKINNAKSVRFLFSAPTGANGLTGVTFGVYRSSWYAYAERILNNATFSGANTSAVSMGYRIYNLDYDGIGTYTTTQLIKGNSSQTTVVGCVYENGLLMKGADTLKLTTTAADGFPVGTVVKVEVIA